MTYVVISYFNPPLVFALEWDLGAHFLLEEAWDRFPDVRTVLAEIIAENIIIDELVALQVAPEHRRRRAF